MRPTLPSITALRVFESAARHLTCTGAANELHLTQSAVSKQLRSLEETLDVLLFHRVNRGLVLTDLGQDYLEEIRPILAQLAAASSRLNARQARPMSLRLHILAVVGDRWLMPRFPEFAQTHPEIDVQFTNLLAGEFQESSVPAVSFLHGEGAWPGHVCDYLFGRELVVLAAPGLIRPGARLRPADARNFPLLHHVHVPDAWSEFFDAYGVEVSGPLRNVQCEFYTTMIRAAISGLGLALVPRMLAAEELARGELVQPFSESVTGRRGYYLAVPQARFGDPAVNAFREWVLKAAEQTRLSTQTAG